MNERGLPLGRILGIPIRLDYSWFLIFLLLTWTLAVGYYPAEFKNWTTGLYWIVGAATAIMLFVSVLLHELGHSIVALRYKIPVKRITLFIFGGVAQIASEPPSANAEFWIAIAGPAVSLALAVIFGVLSPAFASLTPMLALVKYLAYINGALALFNLIPGFPLDGGRIFRAVVWGMTHNLHRATIVAGTVGRFIGYAFIVVGVWLVFAGNLINGLWIAFIGWFLESAAASQVQQQSVHEALAGHTVSEAMSTQYTRVPEEATLEHLVDHHVLGAGRRTFFVTDAFDDVVGLLTVQHIREVPRSEWATTPARQIMMPIEQYRHIQPDADLWEALEEMERDEVSELPVMRNGDMLGMLSREDVAGYLRTVQQLNGS